MNHHRRSLAACILVGTLWAAMCGALCGCGGGAVDDGGTPEIGDPPGAPYTISGTVTAGGDAVEGATVTISTAPDPEEATTGADGTYGFWVAAGAYTVRAEKAPFQPTEVDVTLLPGEQLAVDIALGP